MKQDYRRATGNNIHRPGRHGKHCSTPVVTIRISAKQKLKARKTNQKKKKKSPWEASAGASGEHLGQRNPEEESRMRETPRIGMFWVTAKRGPGWHTRQPSYSLTLETKTKTGPPLLHTHPGANWVSQQLNAVFVQNYLIVIGMDMTISTVKKTIIHECLAAPRLSAGTE